MNHKYFNEKEMELLRKNPYTFKVTDRHIFFTASFKKAFLQLYDSGKTAREAVIELGYDPEVLGKARVNSIRRAILNQMAASGGLHEGPHNTNKLRSALKASSGSTSDEIARLQQEVAFLREEIEFLKKSIALARKGKGSR